MDTAALRNFKDFLQIYNKMTENCFLHCTNILSDRERSSDEIWCVDHCAQKHINVNHKIMKLYMEIQPEFTQRKIEEANKIQQQMMETQNSVSENVPN
ncbi:mitochondrial import inner membrane translocase subunit Tim10 B [Planococcus citri]|uniref:mitochondrial import inner membrane translocase subunit Tim10 B n=1 Tax=Planococcus citri TaxID=170843 RepID=UPI0031F9CB99